ncbi:MAG: metal-sensitive transcriptional regulator [Armatimonadota bacterium]
MIEEGRSCAEVVCQLSAARKALDKVGFLVVSHRVQECLEHSGAETDASLQEALKMFMSLA